MGDPVLRKFHNIIYPGQPCKKTVIKRNLRKFKGFDKDADKDELTEIVHTKFMKMDTRMMKLMADILNLSHIGSKEDLCGPIVEFCFNPQPTGNPFLKPGQKPKKKKKKIYQKKKKTPKKTPKRKPASDGPKRPPSAYILFSNDMRTSVREKHPDMKITEVTKTLAVMWREK